jgi:hypothetical protein
MGTGGEKTTGAAAPLATATAVSGKSWDATQLEGPDAFINDLDLEGFRREISDLGSKLASEQGPADIAHLNKICMWR